MQVEEGQDVVDVMHDVWKECSKNEICEKGIPHDQFKIRKDEDDYLDNLVEKLDILCESKFKIGLIGSMYLIGVIASLVSFPILADKCGRKFPFGLMILVSVFA